MSDNIPFELQTEIIHRIPDIKWVIQYRSVSKAWKSLIDSKEFVSAHTLRHIHRQPRRLLIKGRASVHPLEIKFISVLDDETFPHQKSTLFVPGFCKSAKLIGISHGLVCLYDDKIKLDYIQAVIDGVIYWEAVDSFENLHAFITSFDLTSEEFTELHFPNPPRGLLTVSNLRDSLGVFDMDPSANDRSVDVWIMRGRGATRSFELLYHIIPSVASSINMTLGFRRSGAPIVELNYLAAYEPESNDFTEIWRSGMSGTCRVHSYMETLLLLDH